MAMIFEDGLKASLKNGIPTPVYIITGDDGYLKKMYVERIIKLSADKDDVFNYNRFNNDCDLQDVYDSVVQLPVMAQRRCTVLCDYDIEHIKKTELDRLCTLISETGESSVLIIWFDSLEPDVKKNAAFKKIFAAAEKAGGIVATVNHRRTPELVKMLTDGAAKRGCKMEASAARRLIETAGDDINTLVNELEKLCCYSHGGIITDETVEKVSAKTVEASIYDLSKSILLCDSAKALKMLDDLFFMHIEPIAVLYAVSSAYIDMYRVFLGRKAGQGNGSIASAFGYKGREFVLDRAAQNLSKMETKKFTLSFEALVSADRELKAYGSDPRIVLEQLVVRLIYIIARGESVDKA